MTVYCLVYWNGYGNELRGIFSTLAKAEERLGHLCADPYVDDDTFHNFHIEEREVDA